MGELENQAKLVTGNVQVAAVAKEKTPGNMQLFLFLENCPLESNVIAQHLQLTLPFYMQPTKIINTTVFPLTPNGKINRDELIELIL